MAAGLQLLKDQGELRQIVLGPLDIQAGAQELGDRKQADLDNGLAASHHWKVGVNTDNVCRSTVFSHYERNLITIKDRMVSTPNSPCWQRTTLPGA